MCSKDYRILTTEYNGSKFRIEEDLPEVGWYIYKFDSNGKIINDYLQESVDIAKEFCKDQFGIPENSWK